MDEADQSPQKAQLVIDPDVQSRRSALPAQSPYMDRTKHLVGLMTDRDTVTPDSNAVTASPLHAAEAKDSDGTPPNDMEKFETSGDAGADMDEGIWHERAPWAAPPSPSPNPLAGLADPHESHPDLTPIREAANSCSSRTHAESLPVPPRRLSSLLNKAITYLGSCIGGYFTSAPGVIEYSGADILRNTQIGIEAEEITFPNKPAVIKIVAIVTDSYGADREKDEKYEAVERRVELRAKPKRVKEILRGERYYIAEDYYRKEIRLAFKALGKL
ncbi:uncharacterized protein J4E88_002580 [Alternaria novae-zelandiae]|uniref:uncharacterized protein n=1 Tax=Alternaria novae-zelandiae TaxID=430562 RepID=UPI0020C1FEE1|nr:uncharacterized protein J4E88_002580 [Alternaria novae-zelandiae]KAI4689230.1 hypothetical protein J4E88_002580 [Alternaria novae-zelandiae]